VFIDPDRECLEVRVLKARKLWPPVAPAIELDDVAGLAASLAELTTVMAVHVEFDRPDILWAGALTGVDSTNLRLLEVDTRAEWHRKPRSIDRPTSPASSSEATMRRLWHSSPARRRSADPSLDCCLRCARPCIPPPGPRN
jgi:hypothetical protein